MKNSVKLLALAVLAAGASVFAQNQPAAQTEAGAGLLGQRYAELSLGYIDVNKSGTNVWGPSLDVNLPINSYLDATVSWARVEAEGSGNGQSNGLAGAVTGYMPLENGRTFGTFAVGYNWIVPGKDDWSYTIEGGYEYPVNSQIAVRVSAGYSDDFHQNSAGTWDGTLKGIYKFTEKFSGSAAISAIDGGHIGYTIGGIYKF